jgi:hypothetical protein
VLRDFEMFMVEVFVDGAKDNIIVWSWHGVINGDGFSCEIDGHKEPVVPVSVDWE